MKPTNVKMKKFKFISSLLVIIFAFFYFIPISVRANTEDKIAYNEVQTAETGMVNPAIVLLELNVKSDLQKAVKDKVNVVIADVDDKLNVVDKDGEKLGDVATLSDNLRTGTLIAYKVDSVDEVNALTSCFGANGGLDTYILSSDESLVYSARKKCSFCYGVLDLRGQENLTTNEIVKKTNQAYCKIALLDGENLTVDYVDNLRKRYVTVWAEDLAPTRKSSVELLLTGINGVLTDNVGVYSSTYTEFFSKPISLVRKTFTIGHRGSTATNGVYSVFGPENTLESAQKAYFDGMDYVEIDVHFTLDKEIVVMHDSTIGSMMNATGLIETTNYADLLTYTYKGFDESFKIPTLRQMIEYFKQTDCMLVIELKDYGQALAKAVTDLVKEMNFENQCVIICFAKSALEYCYQNAPEIPCGALESTDHRLFEKVYDEKHDVYKNGDLILSDTLLSTYEALGSFNTTYNPGYNVLNEKLIKQLINRGTGVNLWTLNNISQIELYIKQGVSSVTIDGAAAVALNIRTVSTDKPSYKVDVGNFADVKVYGNYFARFDYDGNPVKSLDITDDNFAVPMIVEGDAFEVEEGKLKAVKTGESTVVYRYKTFATSGEQYIYSQPITLTAEESTRTGKSAGCSGSVSLGAIGVVMLLGGVVLLKKKEN